MAARKHPPVQQRQGIDDPDVLARLVRLSAGSPGQGMALADESLWKFRRSLLEALVKPNVDSVGQRPAGRLGPASGHSVNP